MFVLLLFALPSCLCRDLPLVDIPGQGQILAAELTLARIKRILVYYGVPYAKPPLEKLRFAPPATDDLPSWEGVKNLTDYPPSCLQTKEDFRDSEKPFLQLLSNLSLSDINEDCLYLNIFTPYGTRESDRLATIIWFHPGNFTTGTPAIWNPHTLVYRQRVIVVTVAWRLNIMGFLTTMDGEASGNFGLMDQQAAMKWVKKNIQLFGGNPDNISIMGYGTGATSVGLHMINPNSRGLFHKAIAMSGDLFSPNSIKLPEEDKELLDKLAKDFLCNRKPTSQLISCLRNADPLDLVRQTSNVNWRPLLDTGLSNNTPPFLPEPPRNQFESRNFEAVPLLTGYTTMERVLEIEGIINVSSNISDSYPEGLLQQALTDLISGDIPQINNTYSPCKYNYEHIIDAVMFFYGPTVPVKDVEMLRNAIINFVTEKTYASSTFLHATYMSQFQKTFVYRFDMKPSTPAAVVNLPEWVTVPHLFDLIYVWGVPYWKNNIDWDYRDKTISDTVMSFWTNFAKYGDPTQNSIYPVKWKPFYRDNPDILIIDNAFNMANQSTVNYKAFEFWNDFFPKVLDIGTMCCVGDSSVTISLHRYLLVFIVGGLFLDVFFYRF